MQLFSRNKAIIALSLGALALGACGDDVTVPVAPAAPITLSITPPSANMNIGESVNFAVQISGGPSTGGPTLASCTSSSATVATATSATATAGVGAASCRVTAVGAGNATITATSSTGQSAAASVSVSAPAPAITSLAVSPSAAQLAVGGSVTIVPTVQPAGRTATYTYTSSSATIASVTAAGVVTAVAPGVATITVSATGTAAGFTTATINQAVTITVSDRAPGLTTLNVQPSTVALAQGGTQALTASAAGPRASAATITYGTSAPSIATVSTTGVITAVSAGTAVVTVTAQSAEAGAFAASSITALIPVTVSPNAQVAIVNLTQGGSTIDISNVTDQIEANIAIQPNGQTVSEVNLWICAPAETVAACAARTNGVPAARQSFTASGSQAATVQMYVNTSEFTTPDFTTGADANTLYKNGLRTLVATLTTSPAAASTIASNSISQVNFNNPDGWTVSWTAPANRANDAANITWYGGPDAAGSGSFTVVPVVYTPGRSVVEAVLNLQAGCGANITDRTRPFSATYGTAARDTVANNFNCTGAVTNTAGTAPVAVSGVDNNNNSYAGVTSTPAIARSIFADFTNIANGTVGGFRQSLGYRPNNLYLPHDYQAPQIVAFDVRGGGGSGVYVDSGWVNADYAFNQVVNTTTGITRWRVRDNSATLDNNVSGANVGRIGVGLRTARDTRFDVCRVPTTIPTDAPVTCATPVATGGLTATVAGAVSPMNLAEAADLTNAAYFAIASESDRLGNRAATNPYAYTTPAPASVFVAQTPGVNTGASAPQAFGVDRTAPELMPITRASLTSFINSDADTIYTVGQSTWTDGVSSSAATNATFAARVRDERSGFVTCATTTCPAGFTAGQAAIGTFAIERRRAPATPSLTNDVTIDSLVSTGSSLNVMNAGLFASDNSQRQFTINIFGAAARQPALPAVPAAASSQAGYYQFSGTVIDRAGNRSNLPTRRVAIDNAAPTLSQVILPSTFTGGQTASVTLQGTDDLEVMGAELTISYPNAGVPIRFRRVPYFPSQTGTNVRLGLFHNPFATYTDGKLASTIGQGQTYGGSANLPIPFIHDLQVVNVSSAPTVAGAPSKPTAIAAQLFDVRSMLTPTGTTSSWTGLASASQSTSISAPTVSQDATVKDWTAAGTAVQSWSVFAATSTSLEYRVATSTSVTNPPFSAVHIVRRAYDVSTGQATEHDYLGRATFAGTVDEGGLRYYRYTFAPVAIGQGNLVSQPAIGSLDELRAIGVDAGGNGLLTNATTLGTLPSITSITMTGRTITNAAPAYGLWRSSFTVSSATNSTNASVSEQPFVLSNNGAAGAQYTLFASVVRPNGTAVPTYACFSSNPLVATVSAATVQALPAATATTATISCAVTYVGAGSATITMQAQSAAQTGFAGATVTAATTVVGGLGDALSALTNSTATVNVSVGTTATYTITPTYLNGSHPDHQMTYINHAVNPANTANQSLPTGVSVACVTNTTTGVATCTVTATASAVVASPAGTIAVRGRAVGPTFFSSPLFAGLVTINVVP